MQSAWKVGDLAKKTGVSIRTLHYYDEIGLLSPSCRTEAGYRLYNEDDIMRLQQIMSLRQIGLSLEEIRECLGQCNFSFTRVIQIHKERLQEQIELSHKLLNRLNAITEMMNSVESVSIEVLMQTIEVICMLEKYYTPEQLETLKQRQELLGEERIQQSQADWQDLIKRVQTEMEKGSDPTGAPMQKLARRWFELIEEFTGGDAGIKESLFAMYRQEDPQVLTQSTADKALYEYMNKAIAAMQQAG
jgi:MerR family transcriptional regulator, thiopeptide resistance regulator